MDIELVGMEDVWILPAIPFAVFILVSFLGRLIPRNGDFIAVLGMTVVVVLVGLVLADFQSAFHDEVFAPIAGGNTYSFDWIDIGDGFFIIEFSTYVDSVTMVMLPVAVSYTHLTLPTTPYV